jgi:pimeloyl-ACP methyl ester carboxylesterase
MRNRCHWRTAIISDVMKSSDVMKNSDAVKNKCRQSRWLLVLVAALSVTACSSLFFFPSPTMFHSPAEADLAYEDIWIDSADGTRLHAWWLPAQGQQRGVIYFLHGNAENISTHIGSVYWLPAAGYSVLLMDYRGYGQSAGTPELPAVLQDIEAGMQWVFAKHASARVFMLAQSLGAAMSSYVLATHTEWQQQLTGVIFDAGFADYADMAQDVASRSWITWLLQWPARLTVENRFATADAASQITQPPLLYFHSRDDQVVPYRLGETLFAGLGASKCFVTTQGPHIMTFTQPENRALLLQYLNDPSKFFAEQTVATPARKDLRCESLNTGLQPGD